MTGLTAIREEVAERLTAAGIKARVYIGEAITPPCAVVVPGQPYVDARPNRGDQTFGGMVLVNVDVLILGGVESAKHVAATVDDLTEKAWAALAPHFDIRHVTRPGTLPPIKGTKYVGAALRLEQFTQEPTAPEETP